MNKRFNTILNSFFQSLSGEESGPEPPQSNAKQKAHDAEIQQAILPLIAQVIRCDRNFVSETEKFILEFYRLQFNSHHGRAFLETIAGLMDLGTEGQTKIACRELSILTTHDSRIFVLRFLFGVAASDDFINSKEIRCIRRIAGYLNISDSDFKEIQLGFTAGHNPHKVLGIEPDATWIEVKAAYRKMVLQFHPDKRAAQISEKEAALKFGEIKKAFEIIRKMHAAPNT